MARSNESIGDDLFFLLGFLVSSAEGLATEPPEYGTYRLLDAAKRVLGIMEDYSLATDDLLAIGVVLRDETSSSMDYDATVARLREILRLYAEAVNRRLNE